MLRELRLHPFFKRLHERLAMLLMKAQALFGRQFGGASVRIIFIYSAERFQNVTAGFWKAGGDLHKLPAAMRETVSQQNRDAFGERGGVAGQCVGHLQRRGQSTRAMVENIA